MSLPDLPAELWLEVLSYFPPAFVMNLMGVNRMFFELALDYKYEELQLLSCNGAALNSFQQLSHENISRRVRCLLLRPDFLPVLEDANDDGPSRGSIHQEIRPSWFPWLKKKLGPSPSPSQPPSPSISPPAPSYLHTVDPAKKTLQVATANLVKCRNLREVKIVISDYAITANFSRFLSTLWDTVGSGLSKLCIQTTHRNVPGLLRSVSNHRERLSSLSSFELTMMHPRRPTTSKDAAQTTNAITHFFASFKDSLSWFSFSSFIDYDLSPLFDKLGNLQLNLKRIDLYFVLCDATLSNRSSLVHFLAKQEDALEHLVLDPRPRRSSEFFFPYPSELGQFLLTDFTKVFLPNVRTFQVGHTELPSTLVPSIMPNLSNLILNTGNDNSLRTDQLGPLLTATFGQLISLEVYLQDFSHATLGLLAHSAPNLQRLTLGYSWYGIFFEYSEGIEAIASRRHEGWMLEYLRLGERGQCGEIHPRPVMMDAVAKTVPMRMVEKDREYRCLCIRPGY
ncbi:hypothetical protein BKA70DRAFT_1108388 [Coprinopsis sp. MPI-PUGE-AT-0042]|nr:hypothetical protein BKA70DRAFT_1108388 [Coprinopsis sp. MPI-PUGE-AT-0042]